MLLIRFIHSVRGCSILQSTRRCSHRVTRSAWKCQGIIALPRLLHYLSFRIDLSGFLSRRTFSILHWLHLTAVIGGATVVGCTPDQCWHGTLDKRDVTLGTSATAILPNNSCSFTFVWSARVMSSLLAGWHCRLDSWVRLFSMGWVDHLIRRAMSNHHFSSGQSCGVRIEWTCLKRGQSLVVKRM